MCKDGEKPQLSGAIPTDKAMSQAFTKHDCKLLEMLKLWAVDGKAAL